MYFLGYSTIHKGFRCYDPTTTRCFITRHAQFDETLFPFFATTSTFSPTQLDITIFDDIDISPPPAVHPLQIPASSFQPSTVCRPCTLDVPSSPQIPTGPRAPTTNPPAPPPTSQPRHHMITRSKAGIFKPRCPVDLTYTALLSALATNTEPRGFKSAMKSPQWHATMQEEIDALHSNKMWVLVPRPPGVNIVGSKWIFRTKFHSDGSIERHKARLVAQGFT